MEVRSLGYKTDLIFPAFDGDIVDRGSYLVVRTPSNPTFYWGNFLLFGQPPAAGDYSRWTELFAREIGLPPQTEHIVFGWDSARGEPGEDGEFLANGFRRACGTVLSARSLQPPAHPAADAVVRPLVSDDDWSQAVEDQVASREPEFSESGYRIFRRRAMDRYRKMAARGLGDWFGAFDGGTLVADLGIFRSGTVGRYQSVQTRPERRRRGYAGTLVYQASRYAMEHYGLEVLVIVAETDSDAGRLYQSLGFSATERQAGLEKWKFEPG